VRASGGCSSSRRSWSWPSACSSSSSCCRASSRTSKMQPPAEHVHWLFATGFLTLGLCLLGEAIVGTEVWRRRAWRAYLWPSVFFVMGVLMWPVMTFFTNSTIHMLAHGTGADVLMLSCDRDLAPVFGHLSPIAGPQHR